MEAIDPRYIVLAGFLIAAFCSVISFLVRRNFADTIPGLSAWTWGCLFVLLSSALFVLRPAIPSTLSIVLANAVLTAGCLLLYIALREFTGSPGSYRRMVGAWLVLVCLLTGFIYAEQYPIATSLISLFNAAVFFTSGITILRIRKTGLVEWLTGGAFLLTSCASYVRSFSAAHDFQAPYSLFDLSLLQTLYIASFPFVLLSTTIGFMLMANERVRAMVVGINANLESAVERRTAELREEISRRKGLEREMAQLVEKERRRIGQELHDNLGQRMTGLSLLAEALATKLKTISADLFDHASAIERTASEAILETRRLAHGLMPVIPGAKNLRAALTELTESVSLDGTLQCTSCSDIPIEVVDEYVATHLYRIAQESISNIIRHGYATVAAIRLDRANGKTILSITDNGKGFSHREGAQGGGHGLRIMAYRASLISYDLNITSAPGSGTTIKVSEC